MCTAPASNLSPRDMKALETTKMNGKTLFARGYGLHFVCDPSTGEIRRGIYNVVKPAHLQKPGELPVVHTVDVIAGTCSGPFPCCFDRLETCQHVVAVTDLVFRGVAEGMPAEWIAEFYDPGMDPNADLAPERDTVTLHDPIADLIDFGEPLTPVTGFGPAAKPWHQTVTPDSIYQPCPICLQPVPRGAACNRDHAALVPVVVRQPQPKRIHAPEFD